MTSPTLVTILAIATLIAVCCIIAVARAESSALPAFDSDHVNAGRRVYEQYCAACHGARGEGAPNWTEPDEHGELPAPPHGPEGHTWKHSDAMLNRMISQGWRDPFNKTQRLAMPAFENILSPDQIAAVITNLKTLWTPKQRQFQQEENRRDAGVLSTP
jgi:mono/diheme cytochrome c family protein